jgi:hypothetical protein
MFQAVLAAGRDDSVNLFAVLPDRRNWPQHGIGPHMPPADDTARAFDKRRKAPRKTVIKPGRIMLEGAAAPIECVVLSVSAGGARIRLRDLPPCPDRFDLQIGGEPTRHCNVAWRTEESMGVEFVARAGGAKAHVEERRAKPRTPALRTGILVFKDGYCTMECEIIEISAGGARIKPLDPASCPKEFELRIKHGARHICDVVRTHGREFAVKFRDADGA